MPARVRSINVGTPVEVHWRSEPERTAIQKHRVLGPVRVRTLGLDGDRVADPRDHGGVYQAVYAYAREDLDLWSERFGRPLPDGMFGENLTTEGIDVNAALVGEQWRIGTAIVQVTSVRIPCTVFQRYLKASGYDSERWVKRFTAEAKPGPYLQVVQEGYITTGDPIEVVRRPDHKVTVTTMFKALTTERALLPTLLDVGDDLVPDARRIIEAYAART